MRLQVAAVVLLFRALLAREHNTSGVFGEEAEIKCVQDNVKGVQQVMWQLTLPDKTEQNVASLSNTYGGTVNNAFKEKVVVTTGTSLSSPSITVKNLTWSDECCYVCWFNTYPEGSSTTRSCLSVEGISNVTTEVNVLSGDQSGQTQTVSFFCSATGKPTPEIRWVVSDYSGLQSDQTLMNLDRTWTRTSNLTLEVPRGWAGEAVCLVNPGKIGAQEKRIKLPVAQWEEDEKGGKHNSIVIVFLILAVLVSLAVISLVVCVWKFHRREKKNMQNENANKEDSIALNA